MSRVGDVSIEVDYWDFQEAQRGGLYGQALEPAHWYARIRVIDANRGGDLETFEVTAPDEGGLRKELARTLRAWRDNENYKARLSEELTKEVNQ